MACNCIWSYSSQKLKCEGVSHCYKRFRRPRKVSSFQHFIFTFFLLSAYQHIVTSSSVRLFPCFSTALLLQFFISSKDAFIASILQLFISSSLFSMLQLAWDCYIILFHCMCEMQCPFLLASSWQHSAGQFNHCRQIARLWRTWSFGSWEIQTSFYGVEQAVRLRLIDHSRANPQASMNSRQIGYYMVV